MKKIISLFQRNYDGDRLVRDEVTPGAEWVLAGEGTPTWKLDGTCCLVELKSDRPLWKRYDVKKGRMVPADFRPAQEADPVTGHWPGWVPCDRGNPADRYHWEAFDRYPPTEDGTYELVGPKVQGNPEGVTSHVLVKHGSLVLAQLSTVPLPMTFESIKAALARCAVEGVVWEHRSGDGRMVKIKLKDFGLQRPTVLPLDPTLLVGEPMMFGS